MKSIHVIKLEDGKLILPKHGPFIEWSNDHKGYWYFEIGKHIKLSFGRRWNMIFLEIRRTGKETT